ncbi:MAG: alpha/beta hydrolase [Candidatus Shapirobacteria bacterium]|nr:alpha/beta hydrolase [Candidatus Shapirobacteria bacterium]
MNYEEKVFFEVVNNIKIFCTLLEPENNQKKIVIMNHGFRGSSIGPARTFVDFSRLLGKEGYSVLRFDQANSANSEGDYINSSFREWVETTKYFALKYLNLGYQITLLGHSLGGAVAIITATETELKDKIKCLFLWAPGDYEAQNNIDSEEMYEQKGYRFKGKFLNEVKKARVKKCLKNYQGGIHLVFGESDKYINEESRNEFKKIVESKGEDYMVLPGQDHSDWEFKWAQRVYEEEIKKLKKYL